MVVGKQLTLANYKCVNGWIAWMTHDFPSAVYFGLCPYLHVVRPPCDRASRSIIDKGSLDLPILVCVTDSPILHINGYMIAFFSWPLCLLL